MYIKRDKYLKSRGGTYKIYDLYCTRCNKKLFTYQKDGKGALRRLYLDRIKKYHNKHTENKKVITCTCKKMIGYKYIFPSEARTAIKLFSGSLAKRINKNY